MKNRRPITEDDIFLTEMLIAKSYGNLKQTVKQASADTFGSLGETVGETVRTHPYATAGAAVGAGIVLFGLFKLMNRNSSSKEKGRERSSGAGMDIISIIMPILTPYLSAYLEKSLGETFSKGLNRNV